MKLSIAFGLTPFIFLTVVVSFVINDDTLIPKNNQETGLDVMKSPIESVNPVTSTPESQTTKDKKDINGRTALMNALKKGDLKLVKLFIDNGADVNFKDSNGDNLLMWVRKNNEFLDKVRPLIYKKAKKIPQLDIVNLCYDDEIEHYEEVKELIDRFVDVNYKDVYYYDYTALIHASENGHKNIVKLLLECGANVNDKNKLNNTALIRAFRNGHKDVVELLIGYHADVNAKNNVNSTALIYASMRGHKDIVKVLLKNNAHLNAINYENRTALDYAKEEKHQEVAKILISHGAIDRY